MKREILFRGKSLDTRGAWVEGSLIHRTDFYGDPCDDYFILYNGEFDCDYYDADRVDPETIGQFTGLTDKNGKKIFEGDIIRNEYVKEKIQFFKIFFNETSLSWEIENKYGFCGKLCHVIGSTEVIGNIHDYSKLWEVV